MDQKEKMKCCSYDEEVSGMKKFCADCKTTKTPLWRGGPNGPKTLCNACGIRYRKKRASSSSCTVRMNKGMERKRERAENGNGVGDLRESLRMKLVALGEEVLLQHSVQQKKKKKKKQRKKRKKLGEEEQAAFCLMALSCGFVFA